MSQFIIGMTCYIFPICSSCCPEPFKTLLSVLKNDYVGCINGCPCPLAAHWLTQWQEIRGQRKRRQGTDYQLPLCPGARCWLFACLRDTCLLRSPSPNSSVFLDSSSHSLSLPLQDYQWQLLYLASPGALCHPFWFPKP